MWESGAVSVAFLIGRAGGRGCGYDEHRALMPRVLDHCARCGKGAKGGFSFVSFQMGRDAATMIAPFAHPSAGLSMH